MPITLRAATTTDLPLLSKWDEKPHVVESDPNDDWDWEHELGRQVAWREQLIAELDGLPIGFVQIIDPAEEDSHYWGGVPPNLRAIDIWIGEEDYLNQGHGTEIMKQAIERCFAPPEVAAILIDPLLGNTRSHRFYQRLGFAPIERRSFGQDDCLVHRLDRQTWASRAASPRLPIGYWIKKADELLTSRIDEAQRQNGLTRLAWQILNMVRDAAAPARNEVAATLRPFARAAVVDETLNALAERGLVRRLPAGLLELTPEGAALHERALESQQTVRSRAVEGIEGADYATTVRVLQRLVRNLESADGR
jgi:aminoglycoside 6'-N-acetyltransferase